MLNKTVSMDTNNHPELTLHIDALPDPATITTPSRNVNVVAGGTASTLQQIVLLRYILEIVFCMGDDKIPTVEFRGFSNHEIHQIFSQINIQDLVSTLVFRDTKFHVADLESVAATPVFAHRCEIIGTDSDVPDDLSYRIAVFDCLFHGLMNGNVRVGSILPEEIPFFVRKIAISTRSGLWQLESTAIDQILDYMYGLLDEITCLGEKSRIIMDLVSKACRFIPDHYGDNLMTQLNFIERDIIQSLPAPIEF